jgi:dTDP-4-dehydrorhamnose 3,5-epimerase
MKFTPLPLAGAFVIDIEKHADSRGHFARTYCSREFQSHNIASEFVQCNISFNAVRGILRGLHYQSPPCTESKLVRCERGAIYDVIVDLRPDSQTYKKYFGLELTSDNCRSLYIPEGFAHGFQTLEDATEVFYQMSTCYSPEHSSGIRHDDPEIGVTWPLDVTDISDRDLHLPLLSQWKNPWKETGDEIRFLHSPE